MRGATPSRAGSTEGRRTDRGLKITAAILGAVLVVLQARLWFGDGGVPELYRLHQAVDAQRDENAALVERNRALEAEVEDLKSGLEAIEERARSELGMVRDGETFFQVVEE